MTATLYMHQLATSNYIITVDAVWLDFVVATILPILVAVAKRRYAHSSIGAILLVTLAVVEAIAREIQAHDGTFDLYPTLVHFFITLVTAIAVHYGVLKPMTITGDNGIVQRAIPMGIGSPQR